MLTLEDAKDIARRTGWLSELPAQAQDSFLRNASLRTYSPRNEICRHGDEFQGMYGVVSGAVDIRVLKPDQDFRSASVKLPVYWFGQVSAMERAQNCWTVSAITHVSALFISQRDFDSLVEDPIFCRAASVLTNNQLRDAYAIQSVLLEGDVNMRITARLVHLASQAEEGAEVTLPITQDLLAELCCVSRPTVNKALAELESRKLLISGYKKIQIPSPRELSAFLQNTKRSDCFPRADSSAE